jgi:hypothetical protein
MYRRLLSNADHRIIASLQHELACTLEAQGELVESVRVYRESLAMLRRIHGAAADHDSVAASMTCIAAVLVRTQWPGDLAEAAHLARAAVVMNLRLGVSVDDPRIMSSRGCLALVLRGQGDEAGSRRLAQEYYRRGIVSAAAAAAAGGGRGGGSGRGGSGVARRGRK